MYKYRILFSVVNVDGKNKIMLAYTWLEKYLVGDELQEFLAEYEIIKAYDTDAIQQGKLILQPIFETITADNGTQVTIEIGQMVERDIENSPIHTLAHKWVNRFKNDPAVVKFNDEEPL